MAANEQKLEKIPKPNNNDNIREEGKKTKKNQFLNSIL